MNTIEGLLDKSDYGDYPDFVNFCVDGEWLDEKLNSLYPDKYFKGLIPTLDYALSSEAEKKVVWERVLPNENLTLICPLLMCPDDLDFSCTLIVGEIRSAEKFIYWLKLGVDRSKEWEADKVGTTVEWFDSFPELCFEKAAYTKMLSVFKQQYELERVRWDK
jgi:hypothetical protein